MKTDIYVSDLVPVIKKDTLLEEIETVKQELATVTEPEYAQAVSIFRGDKFSNSEIKSIAGSYSRIVGGVGSEGFIGAVSKGLSVVQDNLDKVTAIVDAQMGNEVASAAITFRDVNLMQFVDYSGFVTLYARRLLSLIYVYESTSTSDDGMQAAEVKWVKDNAVAFCEAMRAVTTPTSKLEKILTDLPEVAVSADSINALRGQGGPQKTDPLKFGFISARYNPIFRFRMIWAERNATKYKAAKTEKTVLELRRMRLLRERENRPDASLDLRIKQMEMQLSDINHFIERQEKKYV